MLQIKKSCSYAFTHHDIKSLRSKLKKSYGIFNFEIIKVLLDQIELEVENNLSDADMKKSLQKFIRDLATMLIDIFSNLDYNQDLNNLGLSRAVEKYDGNLS